MDFSALLKLKGAWDTFCQNHPKFPLFLNDVKRRGIPAGSEVCISITYPEGNTVKSTIKVKPEDLALLDTLKGLF